MDNGEHGEQPGTAESKPTATTHDDQEWIRQAEEFHATERYFRAAECLSQVADTSILNEHHHRIISMAHRAATARDLLQANPSNEWKRHSERHGTRDTVLYYTVEKPQNLLIARIETPMERSLLNPFLAVLNETDLFDTFLPSWQTPVKLGVEESKQMGEFGRGHQIIGMKVNMPFPFLNRECIQHVFAVDSIDEPNDRSIVIKIDSLDPGLHLEGVQVESAEKGWKRVDFDGAFWIGACDKDHPVLHKANRTDQDEDLIMVKSSLKIDAHIAGVPQSLINFFHRNVLGSLWGAMLRVAEEVRDGKREVHMDAIRAKPELYEWVQQRVDVLMQSIADAEKSIVS